jgi:hypothetical protein
MRLVKFLRKIGQAIKKANETKDYTPMRRHHNDMERPLGMHNNPPTDVNRLITDPAYSSLSCNIHYRY